MRRSTKETGESDPRDPAEGRVHRDQGPSRGKTPGTSSPENKAARVAAEAANDELIKVLDAARSTLAPAIVGLGLRIPEKAKRGRKRKGEAA